MQGGSRFSLLTVSSGDDVSNSEVTNNVLRVLEYNLAIHNLSSHTRITELVRSSTVTSTKLQSRSVNGATLNLSSSQRVKSMRLLAIHQNSLLSRSDSQVRLLSPSESCSRRNLGGRLTAIEDVVVHSNGAAETLLGDSGSYAIVINSDSSLAGDNNLLATLRDSCTLSGREDSLRLIKRVRLNRRRVLHQVSRQGHAVSTLLLFVTILRQSVSLSGTVLVAVTTPCRLPAGLRATSNVSAVGVTLKGESGYLIADSLSSQLYVTATLTLRVDTGTVILHLPVRCNLNNLTDIR